MQRIIPILQIPILTTSTRATIPSFQRVQPVIPAKAGIHSAGNTTPSTCWARRHVIANPIRNPEEKRPGKRRAE